MTPKYQVR